MAKSREMKDSKYNTKRTLWSSLTQMHTHGKTLLDLQGVSDRDVHKWAVTTPRILRHIPLTWQFSNPQTIAKIALQYKGARYILPEVQMRFPEIILRSLQRYPQNLEFISYEFQDKYIFRIRPVIEQCIEYGHFIFPYISPNIRLQNPDLVFEMLRDCPAHLLYLSASFCSIYPEVFKLAKSYQAHKRHSVEKELQRLLDDPHPWLTERRAQTTAFLDDDDKFYFCCLDETPIEFFRRMRFMQSQWQMLEHIDVLTATTIYRRKGAQRLTIPEQCTLSIARDVLLLTPMLVRYIRCNDHMLSINIGGLSKQRLLPIKPWNQSIISGLFADTRHTVFLMRYKDIALTSVLRSILSQSSLQGAIAANAMASGTELKTKLQNIALIIGNTFALSVIRGLSDLSANQTELHTVTLLRYLMAKTNWTPQDRELIYKLIHYIIPVDKDIIAEVVTKPFQTNSCGHFHERLLCCHAAQLLKSILLNLPQDIRSVMLSDILTKLLYRKYYPALKDVIKFIAILLNTPELQDDQSLILDALIISHIKSPDFVMHNLLSLLREMPSDSIRRYVNLICIRLIDTLNLPVFKDKYWAELTAIKYLAKNCDIRSTERAGGMLRLLMQCVSKRGVKIAIRILASEFALALPMDKSKYNILHSLLHSFSQSTQELFVPIVISELLDKMVGICKVEGEDDTTTVLRHFVKIGYGYNSSFFRLLLDSLPIHQRCDTIGVLTDDLIDVSDSFTSKADRVLRDILMHAKQPHKPLIAESIIQSISHKLQAAGISLDKRPLDATLRYIAQRGYTDVLGGYSFINTLLLSLAAEERKGAMKIVFATFLLDQRRCHRWSERLLQQLGYHDKDITIDLADAYACAMLSHIDIHLTLEIEKPAITLIRYLMLQDMSDVSYCRHSLYNKIGILRRGIPEEEQGQVLRALVCGLTASEQLFTSKGITILKHELGMGMQSNIYQKIVFCARALIEYTEELTLTEGQEPTSVAVRYLAASHPEVSKDLISFIISSSPEQRRSHLFREMVRALIPAIGCITESGSKIIVATFGCHGDWVVGLIKVLADTMVSEIDQLQQLEDESPTLATVKYLAQHSGGTPSLLYLLGQIIRRIPDQERPKVIEGIIAKLAENPSALFSQRNIDFFNTFLLNEFRGKRRPIAKEISDSLLACQILPIQHKAERKVSDLLGYLSANLQPHMITFVYLLLAYGVPKSEKAASIHEIVINVVPISGNVSPVQLRMMYELLRGIYQRGRRYIACIDSSLGESFATSLIERVESLHIVQNEAPIITALRYFASQEYTPITRDVFKGIANSPSLNRSMVIKATIEGILQRADHLSEKDLSLMAVLLRNALVSEGKLAVTIFFETILANAPFITSTEREPAFIAVLRYLGGLPMMYPIQDIIAHSLCHQSKAIQRKAVKEFSKRCFAAPHILQSVKFLRVLLYHLPCQERIEHLRILMHNLLASSQSLTPENRRVIHNVCLTFLHFDAENIEQIIRIASEEILKTRAITDEYAMDMIRSFVTHMPYKHRDIAVLTFASIACEKSKDITIIADESPNITLLHYLGKRSDNYKVHALIRAIFHYCPEAQQEDALKGLVHGTFCSQDITRHKINLLISLVINTKREKRAQIIAKLTDQLVRVLQISPKSDQYNQEALIAYLLDRNLVLHAKRLISAIVYCADESRRYKIMHTIVKTLCKADGNLDDAGLKLLSEIISELRHRQRKSLIPVLANLLLTGLQLSPETHDENAIFAILSHQATKSFSDANKSFMRTILINLPTEFIPHALGGVFSGILTHDTITTEIKSAMTQYLLLCCDSTKQRLRHSMQMACAPLLTDVLSLLWSRPQDKPIEIATYRTNLCKLFASDILYILCDGNFYPDKDGVKFTQSNIKGIALILEHSFKSLPLAKLRDLFQNRDRLVGDISADCAIAPCFTQIFHQVCRVREKVH